MYNMIWLSTSLFCCKNEWDKLFSSGIIPFLADEKTNEFLNAYRIEFNYLSGENIRFLLLTKEKNAPKLAKHTDEYFRNYFFSTSLFTPEIKLPVNGIFMPFPANNIKYGLYPPETIINKEKENYIFSIHFSQIILDALKWNIIDNESILTFAFYLQLGLIKAINIFYPGFAPDYVDDKLLDVRIVKTQFEESRDTLQEIARDIMISRNGTEISEWFVKWLASCKSEIKRHKDMEAKTLYSKLVFVIFKNLAITPQMNSMLSYFIERVLLSKSNI